MEGQHDALCRISTLYEAQNLRLRYLKPWQFDVLFKMWVSGKKNQVTPLPRLETEAKTWHTKPMLSDIYVPFFFVASVGVPHWMQRDMGSSPSTSRAWPMTPPHGAVLGSIPEMSMGKNLKKRPMDKRIQQTLNWMMKSKKGQLTLSNIKSLHLCVSGSI